MVEYLHDELRFRLPTSNLAPAEKNNMNSPNKRSLPRENDGACYRLRVVKTETMAVEGLALKGSLATQTSRDAIAAAAVA